MPVLSDPQLEQFAQSLLRNIVAGMPRGKAATAAAREAGYQGSSLVDNARKRANRKDVKARMIELAAPALAQVEAEIAVDVQWATKKLASLVNPDLGVHKIKVTDQIAALKLLAEMFGWLAPEKMEHSLNGHGDLLDQALARVRTTR